MAFTKLSLGILFCLACSLASSAGTRETQTQADPSQAWISLKTPHFEIYTTNTEQQALLTLQALEDVRSFFQQTTSLIQPNMKPVRVIAFRSREEYMPFRLQSTSFAHYLHSRRGDYIVLQDISPEHRRAAVHEYTHYIFRMAGLNLPIWLCEGTADFYSSLDVQERRSTLGGVLPSRLRSLDGVGLVRLQTLFAVDHASPFYNDPSKVALFYGQSWALVHMLAFHPQYGGLFPNYLRDVSSGIPSGQAFQDVYGKSLAEVEADLLTYIPKIADNQTTLALHAVEHLTPVVTALSDVDGAITMADLLAAHRSTAQEAKNRLNELSGRNPGNPQAEELLAYLAAQDTGTKAPR